VDARDAEGRPLVLRTHTSPMQVRYARPAIKVRSGSLRRGEPTAWTAMPRNSPMFHQVEGLWLDEDINFADLKGVYTDFVRRFFESEDLQVRFRPSYFPSPSRRPRST